MKISRKLIIVLFSIITIVSMATISAGAYYRNTGKTFSRKEGGFLGIGKKSYTYDIYKETRSFTAWNSYFDLCMPLYHIRNNGSITLTYTQSKTYTSQTAYNFSASVGGTVGVSDLVKLTLGVTGGITKTKSMAVSASSSVAASYPQTAPTGYYKLTMCYDYDRYRLDRHRTNQSEITDQYYGYLPYGVPYIATLFATRNEDSYYSKY